jgi:Xaa-Pro aminopeptidase
LYIREENIGIRIENDILVTENEPVDLMANIPITVAEIEEMMSGGQESAAYPSGIKP